MVYYMNTKDKVLQVRVSDLDYEYLKFIKKEWLELGAPQDLNNSQIIRGLIFNEAYTLRKMYEDEKDIDK
jgi:hypothetical protein